MFLQDLYTTEYRHLRNVNMKIEIATHLLLSQMLMGLKSYNYATKELFVMAQQKYDDGPVTFSYMAEVRQEMAAVLPIFPLLLKGRLGMMVSRYFRSSYSN